jgi:hypothetical protein
MGYAVPKGSRFDRATHPQERLCWQMAAVAFERLRQTDIAGVAGERLCRLSAAPRETNLQKNQLARASRCQGPMMTNDPPEGRGEGRSID